MLFDVVSLKGEHLSLKGEHTGVCVLSLQGKMVGLQGTGEGRAPPPPVRSPSKERQRLGIVLGGGVVGVVVE